jgi:amidophosphoribosyltransferase
MCGFIGLYADDRAAFEMADALLVLQHRGQDAAGITTFDGESFHTERGAGLVRDIFTEERLSLLHGRFAIGHTRYPTVGGGTSTDAQPLYTNTPFGIAMAHNGNVTNFPQLKQELSQQDGRRLGTECDVEVILNVFAAALKHRGPEHWFDDVATAMKRVFKRVRGSYSGAAIVGGRGLVAFRDPYGIKPAAVGRRKAPGTKGGWHWCVTSESAALQVLGFELVGDLEAGEVLMVAQDGTMVRRQVAGRGRPQHRPCVFEYIYFARPDSVIDDISVYRARLRLGEALARHVKERGLDPDVVVPVPDSARPAALECAHALNVRYREGLQKNRYVGRTFIMPGQANRAKSVRAKLTTLPMELEGKRVLLVDDSIVRGTTTRAVVQMVREAGAREVYLAVSAPKIKHPCVYGVDMQTKDEFLARREKTDDRIAKAIGADAVVYMSIEDMVDAVRGPTKRVRKFCMACMDGSYPTGDVTPEVLRTIESERTAASRAAEAAAEARGLKQA